MQRLLLDYGMRRSEIPEAIDNANRRARRRRPDYVDQRRRQPDAGPQQPDLRSMGSGVISFTNSLGYALQCICKLKSGACNLYALHITTLGLCLIAIGI